ncbi:hypothetical protein ES708_01610 [subsurface metagenome]
MSNNYCPQCGEILQPGAQLCHVCGFQFETPSQQEEVNTQTKFEHFTQPVFSGAKVESEQPQHQFQSQVQYQTQYLAPQVKVQVETPTPVKVKFAENGDRFIAFIIDSMIINAITGLIFHDGGFFWISSGLTILYFAMMEMLGNGAGQTLGKRVMKIRTVDETTLGPISLNQALIHSLGKTFFGLIDLIIVSY